MDCPSLIGGTSFSCVPTAGACSMSSLAMNGKLGPLHLRKFKRRRPIMFDQIPLYEAVCDVMAELEDPGSDEWPVLRQDELLVWVRNSLPVGVHYASLEMLEAWMRMRKASEYKLVLMVEVARKHGRQCYIANRGKGECSEYVSVERIKPGAFGGKYSVENCILMCSRHNSQRGCKTLEEYLS